MPTIDILSPAGEKSGTVELPAEVFDVQTNVPLIHQVVVAQLAAARQGTTSQATDGKADGASPENKAPLRSRAYYEDVRRAKATVLANAWAQKRKQEAEAKRSPGMKKRDDAASASNRAAHSARTLISSSAMRSSMIRSSIRL